MDINMNKILPNRIQGKKINSDDALLCSTCHMLPYTIPKICIKCGNTICPDCDCSNCEGETEYGVMAMCVTPTYKNLRIICRNDGCNKIVDYFDVLEHEKDCPLKKIQCEGCNEFFSQAELQSHQEHCGDVKITCPKCQLQYYSKEENNHCCITNLTKALQKANEKIEKFEKLRKNQKELEKRICKIEKQLENNEENVEQNSPPKEPNPNHKNLMGIKKNVTLQELHDIGFKFVYNKPYSHKTTIQELLSLKKSLKSALLCVGAMKNKRNKKLLICAFGYADEILSKAEAKFEAKPHFGAFWYFAPGSSFGFSPEKEIELNEGDLLAGDERVSWHINNKNGGYRVGNIKGLNNNKDYRKIILAQE